MWSADRLEPVFLQIAAAIMATKMTTGISNSSHGNSPGVR
jgi:hypothetical protein